MSISSSWIHHPNVIKNNKKCETKLPFPHTRQERIEELNTLMVQFEKEDGPVHYVSLFIDRTERKTDQEYLDYITTMNDISVKIAELKETK